MWELSWGESAQERNQCESNDSNDEKIIEIFTLLDLNDAGRINEDEAKHGKWLVSIRQGTLKLRNDGAHSFRITHNSSTRAPRVVSPLEGLPALVCVAQWLEGLTATGELPGFGGSKQD